jgi:glutamate dehydrogenase
MSETRTSDASAGNISPQIDLEAFRRRYLAHAARQLPGRTNRELSALAREHLELGVVRPGGETLIRSHNMDGDTSAIDIVTPDAPFLVDSIRAEFDRAGQPVSRLLHPQIVASRDADGRLEMVYDLDDNVEVPKGAIIEAWMHIETDRLEPADAERLIASLRRVLNDVHLAAADAPAMYALIRELADRLTDDPGEFDREASVEAGDLLRWLADGNFLILGHAAYSAADLAGAGPGISHSQASGVLRGDTQVSPLEVLPAFRSGAPLVIFKSPLVSTVRRSARYDCVTVVPPPTGGEGQTVHVFLGLITTLEDGTVARVPVLRKRIAEILLRSGVRASSHTGRQLLAALRTLPRDELLEAPTADLLRLAQLVVVRAEQSAVGVFARVHLNRDFVSVLVYFPADRFGPETRRRVGEVVLAHWPGEVVARDDRIVELGFARMQFLIALPPGAPAPSPDRRLVESEVARVTRRWSDDLADLVVLASGEDVGQRLLRRYSGAFPEAYKEDFAAGTAVHDLSRLEALDDDDGLSFEAYTPPSDDEADRRLKVFRTGDPLSLAKALPIFSQMNIEVLDERPYEIERSDGSVAWIYDFGLRLPAARDLDASRAEKIIQTLRLLWNDEIEQDRFNALVLVAGLTWWQANVLRAYAKYLRQAGTTFSQGYIEQALIENPGIARQLIELFEARFDPARAGTAPVLRTDDGRSDGQPTSLVEAIEADLAAVASLDQDRILRSLLHLITATLRTNAYRAEGPATADTVDPAESQRSMLAVKLDPSRIPNLPEPRPQYEIWVYSPRLEGVHLRYGPVARGGLRWSDRREDFRTEILGLVKAQMVKNAVIVPMGAKGGFVAKRLPDPQRDREGWAAEGEACYRAFIGCLLELTDNLVTGSDGVRQVVPPPNTRRYDGDDPYLVVAADKGTATFSDIANEIASDFGFWLGDAFASGGSRGYDHKAMGITARGAWESVKFHFRELGVDTQEQDFTVVGIGDMSGDVFGNGMLLSRHIRLVAAFDHRQVFLDPNPDAESSFTERERLFRLPQSSWADYDAGAISAGGGVHSRTLKSIPISDEVAEVLRLPPGVTTMTPNELIHHILLAPVDLLWNGGVGTFVKASSEPQLAAGDRANDAVRVDGAQLRCRVVGEGGNLGFTQLGRIEYARSGGRINTDAIDNSAGVNTSDHEVNLKILLDRAVAAGHLTRDERNELLQKVRDDVVEEILHDNYEVNLQLGMARRLGPAMVNVHARFLRALEATDGLDRELEFLPSNKEIAAREAAAEGLTSPEVAVLSAYSKITLKRRIEDSTLPDEPWFHRILCSYFPPLIVERFGDQIRGHPLRREIITTVLVNNMINRSGTTFVHRATEETGADAAQIARAYIVAREVFQLPQLWDELQALDNQVPIDAQEAAYQELRRLVDRATRWLVEARFPIDDVAGEIERFGPTIAHLTPRVPQLLRGVERDNMAKEVDRFVEQGLPRDLATRIGEMLTAFQLLDVVETTRKSGRPADEVAEVQFTVSEQFSVDVLLTKITELPRDDRWSALARAALRHDVYAALSAITSSVLASTEPGKPATERVAAWERQNAQRVDRALSIIGDALQRDRVDLATLSVALRVMRSLAD